MSSPAPSAVLLAALSACLGIQTSGTQAPRAQAAQFVEMPVKEHLPEFPAGTALAAADFDGDGIDDVVVGALGQDRLFVGDGRGGYSEAASRMPQRGGSSGLKYPNLLHALDVDQDGDIDLVGSLSSRGSGCFGSGVGIPMLYLNDGAGRFADATAGRLQFGGFSVDPTSFASGDVDGDGDVDLVVGLRSPGFFGGPVGLQDQLFLNDGAGGFVEATSSRLPQLVELTRAVEFVDIDGDADLDLVVGTSSGAHLLVNDGAGNFTDDTAARLPVGGKGAVAACDVDGDGDRDLVFGSSVDSSGTGRLYLNDGVGWFIDVTSSGPLPAGVVATEAGASAERILASDLNGDGREDLVFGRRLFLNHGAGGFREGDLPGGGRGFQVLVDADGDGFEGLVFLNGSRYLNGGGVFGLTFAPGLPRGDGFAHAVAVGDLDGDGHPDLAVGGSRLRIFLQDGFGSFHEHSSEFLTSVSSAFGLKEVSAQDVDGDGDLDLLILASTLRLFLNDGQAGFSEATSGRIPSSVGYHSLGLAAGDVDGDADVDLVCAQADVAAGGRQNVLLLNDGSGHFTDASTTRLPRQVDDSLAVALFDADADGDVDLVFANAGQDELCLNDGTGRFAAAPAGAWPNDLDWNEIVVPVDVDQDGDLDLLFDGPRLYLNTGRARFSGVSSGRFPALGARPSSIEVGDLDDDGDPDLVLAIPSRCTPGDHVALLNDGGGAFSLAGPTVLPQALDPNVETAALVDIDADGDLDLFTGNPPRHCGGRTGCTVDQPGPNHLFVNRLTQLRATNLPRLGRGYGLEVHALASDPNVSVFAVPFLSSGTSWTPLPGIGTLRLDPAVLLPLPVVLVPQPAGVASATVQVPADAALAGAELFGQVLLVGWSSGIRLTNAVHDRILR